MPSGVRALLLAAVAALLAVPAAADAEARVGSHHRAATGRTLTRTVLAVDRAHHRLRTVDGRRAQSVWRVDGRLSRRAVLGAMIRFRARRHRAAKLRVVGHAKAMRFYARVVQTRGHKELRLPGGARLALGRAPGRSRRAASAFSSLVALDAYQPGQLVLVTLRWKRGALTVTVRRRGEAMPDGGADTSCSVDANGTLGEAGDDGAGDDEDPGEAVDDDPRENGDDDPGDHDGEEHGEGEDDPGDDEGEDDPGDGAESHPCDTAGDDPGEDEGEDDPGEDADQEPGDPTDDVTREDDGE